MEDLKRSPFLDKTLLQLVQRIIWGQKVSVISSSDKKFVAKAEAIKSLNQHAPRGKGLVSFLQEVQNFVPLAEGLSFLITTEEMGRSDEGFEALEMVAREDKQVDEEMLNQILAMGEDMPFGWAVPIVGDNGAPRHQPKLQQKSSLDFSRLRDFK